ncbi:MAG: DUF2188 domain-containing protein [Firmicutes bacterium]|uniref:Uncharacterized protein n=1 Tax=Melghirimyces thermohalophilus TaxID=1236220 RepID=A0A1G6LC71_9BACL|nr:DUF2188 domain-containing protein [Melghirimyces thermohalophilus]MDA8353178.1 DUF2188 domain-containing protein [Bacillota bacterium]SDC40801.1 hypothetical protein SAMN04488112_107160 [Melghirimyces thermohalophilus]
MERYTVVPNQNATRWFVMVEDIAALGLYDRKSKAVNAAVLMAHENPPSQVIVMNNLHQPEEYRYF